MSRRASRAGLLTLAAAVASASPVALAATPEEARAFIEQAEERLLRLNVRTARVSWINQTYITDDTERVVAEASGEEIAATMELAKEARRFDGLALPEDVSRRLKLLSLSQDLPAPADPKLRDELTEIAAWLPGTYGKGKFCPAGKECLSLPDLEKVLNTSRDPDALLEAWRGWHDVGKPMRPRYERFVALANQGARELGFADMGALWRSNYDMPPDAFAAEMQRLWTQVKPLYDLLHAYVRRRLVEKYGPKVVPPTGPIPAHLLGNMWAQQWDNIYPLVAPPSGDAGYDLTALLAAKKVDERELVRYGERFFTSLGLAPLPETFWERSLFVKPRDRDVVCHANAWDVDNDQDLRIKMCITVGAEDFVVVHHELGHNFYQRAYRTQPFLFRNGAHDGFHEAIGDAIALSVTPDYLVKAGLLERAPGPENDIGFLLHQALDKIAFLPFGLVIDEWRWKVFSGEIAPADYNRTWWQMRLARQNVAPPVPRSEADFDPGAKYHVPGNVPYARYFLSYVLQFQLHRGLCQAAGQTGPLHTCSIYGSKAAGERLSRMLEMGRSRPWPEALKAVTGESRMDGGALLEYFAPLRKWLEAQDAHRH
jgi:peptidyl-dipeptidase A